MRKNILLTGVLGLLALGTLQAQDFRLSPLPQVYETQEDSIDIPTHYSLLTTHYSLQTSLEANSSTLTLLRQLLPGEAQGAKFQIRIGIRGDKSIKKFNRDIPQQAEGYYLKISRRLLPEDRQKRHRPGR